MKILYTHSKTLSGYLMAFAMVMFTYSVSAQTNHDVTIVGNSFSPATLTIDVGDQVTFINDAATGGGGFHNINGTQFTYPSNPDNTLDNGSAASGPWTYVWTCTAAGLYDYQCDPHAGGGMVGTITAAAGGPANDLCANAEVITCASTVTGSTVAATNTDELDNVPGAGVWYVFTGTGDVVTVSTDNAGTDYDTRIGYTDACGNAGIAFDEDGGTDFINGYTSVMTFASTIGTDYYIYVGGYQGTNTGAFEMTVTCTTPLANDLCTGAITVACGGTATGSTVDATSTDELDNVPGPGVWYLFAGTGDEVTVSTDNAGTDYDTRIGYTDACGNAGIAFDEDGGTDFVTGYTSVLTFASTIGTDYYIYVGGYLGTNTGAFEMTVSCTPPLCLADAGTLTVDASPVCLVGGSADISATEADAPVVPAGYTTLYVLSQGAGLVLVDANTVPEFTVTVADDYTIHTLVYDPTVVDIASFPPGTTGFDVNALLIQGGGTVCGALDVTGAPITVEDCSVTGIADNNGIESLNIYPNPSNGQFVLEVNGVDADAQITVMDVTGRQVYTEGVSMNGNFRKELNLNVAKGTYLLQIATVEGTVTRKIQIN
jgi:plastocyanin